MKRKLFGFSRMFVSLVVGVALIGCATPDVKLDTGNVQSLDAKMKSGEFVQKADNFVIVLDSSGTMADTFKMKEGGKTKSLVKLDYARNVAARLNHTIPDVKLGAAVRIFGRGISQTAEVTPKLVYGPEAYSKSKLDNALTTVKVPAGISMLDSAIVAAIDDVKTLRKTSEKSSAVVIISDGKVDAPKAIAAAEKMKKEFGDKVCIYTVFVPSDTADKNVAKAEEIVMKAIAEKSGCGSAVNAVDVSTAEGMGDFVAKMLLTKQTDSDRDGVPDNLDKCPATPAGVKVDAAGCPLDSDKDGVPDNLDLCPDTPAGVKVNAQGCPLDSDGDGVPDDKDLCPNTPAGVKVDAKGCPLTSKAQPTAQPVAAKGPGDSDGDGVPDNKDECPNTPKGVKVTAKGCWYIQNLYFDSGKWDIKPASYPSLDEVVSMLNANPTMKVEVQGHTDNVGGKKYNQGLSDNRAKSVMNYFIQKGITADRLTSKGFGFSKPAESNKTAKGKAANRRVELNPTN